MKRSEMYHAAAIAVLKDAGLDEDETLAIVDLLLSSERMEVFCETFGDKAPTGETEVK